VGWELLLQPKREKITGCSGGTVDAGPTVETHGRTDIKTHSKGSSLGASFQKQLRATQIKRKSLQPLPGT
jgi:hypothetical protein